MIKIFKNFTKKDWSLIIICLAFIILQVWLDLKLPDLYVKNNNASPNNRKYNG